MGKRIYAVPKPIEENIKNELYQYWKNKQSLEEWKRDIIEESVSPDGQPRGNATSDTTQQKTIKILSTRKIIETERRIGFIEEAVKKLTPEEVEVFELIFRDRYSQKLAETQKFISKHTYYHTIDKTVYLTALEFGYI